MDYNIGSSNLSLSASTMSASTTMTNVAAGQDEPKAISVLVEDSRSESLTKRVSERQRLLRKQADGHLDGHEDQGGDLEGLEPAAPMYERKRKAAMESNRKAMKKLIIVLLTSLVFIVVEILGGYYANSIAIMSDAAHIASDVIGFGISICALQIAHRAANTKYTFGYHRVEILGAFCSIFTIWLMTVWLIYEATMRFFTPPEIGGKIMLSVACLSFFFNLIQIKILHSGEGGHVHAGGQKCSGHGHGDGHAHVHDSDEEEEHNHSHEHDHDHDHDHEHNHDHDHEHAHSHSHSHDHDHTQDDEDSVDAEVAKNLKENVNIRAAYLHILGDLLNSVGVIISATIIFFWPQCWYMDPICTYIFAIIVLWTTKQTFWQCVILILETVPEHIDVEKIRARLEGVKGVKEVHDIHVWSLSNDKQSFTCHIILHSEYDGQQQRVLTEADTILRKKYDINHNCIQIEVPNVPDSPHGKFFCGNDIHK